MDDDPRGDTAPDDHLPDALGLLARRCDVELDRPEACRSAAATAPRGEWRARVTHALRALEMRAREVDATRAEVRTLLGPASAAITSTGSAWLVVERDAATIVPAGPAPADATPTTWLIVEHGRPARHAAVPGATPLRRLVGLIRTERRDLGLVLVYAAAAGLLALATPLAIQVLINWLAFGALLQPIVILVGLLLAALTALATVRALQRYAVEVIQRRVFVRMVSDVTGRLSRARLTTFDQTYGPELANRLFDVLTVQKAMATLLLDGLGAALQAAVGLALVAVYHPYLLAFDVVLVAAVAAVLVPFVRAAERTAVVESKRKYQVAAWVEEVARHPVAAKLGGGHLARDRAEDLARAYLTARDQHFRVAFNQLVAFQAVQVLASGGLLLLTGWLVLDGRLTLGQLVAAEFVVAAALAGVAKVVEKLETVYDLLAAMDKLGALVDLPEDRRTGLAPPAVDRPAAVSLRRVGVDLGRSDAVDLDLTVEPGARAVVHVADGALRGRLAEVVAGLREPDRGAVLRDGRDLTLVQPDAAWPEVALLRREEPLLASIRDNVALGRPAVDDVAVVDALTAVGLADRVAGLAGGLDAELGPGGAPLSEGDVLRLLLARALAGRPRLLVVDGALDGPAGEALRPLVDRIAATRVVLTADPALEAA